MAEEIREKEAVNNARVSKERDMTTTEYCSQLQQWMWRYYSGYASWQFWVLMSTPLFPHPQFSCQAPGSSASAYPSLPTDLSTWYQQMSSPPTSSPTETATVERAPARPAGRVYSIPSSPRRFVAEIVDFFILFCVKATIVLWIMHLSGMKDISKFIMHFIVEEIDENASMEDLQKMMVVALAYRVLVCVYEIICIWGAGGATPGKFLLGLKVISCNTTVLVQHSRVLVVPASSVSLSASTVRALNKNFSIAFLFPIFITFLFFPHNRTVYDVVAGTIVVQRRRVR
ncbi:hypothetical protein DNTS_025462 [Danionella cerebrum]|uniref:RDD domain-containing protein n=1 Tax=Danionella cerebrum TaxID=2873325 RepID=A0A553Q362_9TELE|nr:hypothetical protein DNTS_025462 [Danionella translucida]